MTDKKIAHRHKFSSPLQSDNPSSSSGVPPVPPALVLAVGLLAVSHGAIFVRLADAPALVTAAWRLTFSLAVLLPLAAIFARRELLTLSRRDWGLAAGAGFFLALHFATWIASLDYTSVANSVVLVNTIPLWVGLFSPLVTGERLTRPLLVGIGFSLLGILIIGFEGFSGPSQTLRGDGLALLGGLCAAFYIMLGRNLRRKLSLLAYVSLCYGGAAALIWAAVLLLKLPFSGYPPGTWLAFGGLAVVSQLIGHTSYNWALKYVSAPLIAISLLGEPVIGTLLAWLLFAEGLTIYKVSGGLLILSGIYFAATGGRRS